MSLWEQLQQEATSLVKSFLGIKEKSLLGGIPLHIISDKSRSISATVTNRRVEKGFNISDTVRKEPLIFQLTVVDNSKDYMLNRQSLEKMLEAGEPIEFYYSGRDLYQNIVIENIEELEQADRKNCFTYYITLRQISVAEIKATDSKVDYKKAGSTGGKKKRTAAAVKSPTSSENAKIAEKQRERKKTAWKNLF
ncbi:hypothetical protein A2U04_11715 [Fusobacterium necrophorum subsp. funduliforme]|uniref:phage baseplate protein n=1 Tax=Fusobacterium necrophorum TaxID=859 RepID=UPI0007881C62|nr:hypothetical protein [Fusobacterium necrophorum]KYM51370.1 hypothetical protein A2U04_11715 [Fusobacterium necrophorum subsp. funduliforme]